MSSQSSTATAYRTCARNHNDNVKVLECVSNTLEQRLVDQDAESLSWLLILSGALVFFMQAGFAMLCAGCVRKKNVQNTMLKNLLDACGAAVAWYAVGFAFAFGGQNQHSDITFVGTTNFLNMGDVDQAFWFFEYAFSAASVTIVAGTLAERCQMAAYLCYSFFLTGFVYPVVAHSIWSNNGFLSAFSAQPLGGIGAIDFAGSGVVHLTGGCTALMATLILGARKGRFHDARTGRVLDKPKEFPGHSMALQLMGTMVLWFGWYGFNPGSALLLPAAESLGQVGALAAVNTSLSAACGAISALFTNLYFEERKTGEYFFNLQMAMNGALSGLVAVTAACGTVENWAACVIGLVAGWAYLGGTKLLVRYRIDDAVDAVPVHLFGGIWGLLATGLFSSPARLQAAFGTDQHAGLFYEWGQGSSDATLLGNNMLAMVFVAAWSAGTMVPFFLWLNYMGWFRADALEELVGLDLSYHGKTQVLEQFTEDPKEEHQHQQAFQRRREEEQVRRRTNPSKSRCEGDKNTSAETCSVNGEEGASWSQASWTDLSANHSRAQQQEDQEINREVISAT